MTTTMTPEIADIISRLVRCGKIRKNECFTNAFWVLKECKGKALFVVGYLYIRELRFRHAWLEIDGVVFDPTALVFFGEPVKYQPIHCWTKTQFRKVPIFRADRIMREPDAAVSEWWELDQFRRVTPPPAARPDKPAGSPS